MKFSRRKMNQYIPKPFDLFGGDINVKVDLSDYATKADFKNATGIDTSKLAAKSDLISLKAGVDKLDTDKLVLVPVDWGNLSNIVKNDVVKKAVHSKLVNNNDTSGFVLKTKYDTDKIELKTKISDTSGLVKKTDYNPKTTEIENEIPSISVLATNSALTEVENKIPDVSSLVKKTESNKKFLELKKTCWSWSLYQNLII